MENNSSIVSQNSSDQNEVQLNEHVALYPQTQIDSILSNLPSVHPNLEEGTEIPVHLSKRMGYLGPIQYKINRDHSLHRAVMRENVEEAAQIIATNANLVNTQDAFTLSPLYWATLNGNSQITQLLLENGAVIDSQDILNTIKENDINVLKILLTSSKADGQVAFNIHDLYEPNPLHFAIEHNRPEAVTLLLNSNADANQKNALGYTPMFSATYFNREEIINLLQPLVIPRDTNSNSHTSRPWQSVSQLINENTINIVSTLWSIALSKNSPEEEYQELAGDQRELSSDED